MFGTSNYQKISIFSEIGHSWHFCDMAAILKKNGGSKEQFKYYHHVRHIKLPQDINFHWNRTKLKFSRIGGHFEKKMTARKKFLIVPSCSPHQKQHIPIWITSLTIILSEISNVKVKKFEKTALKGNNSYNVSPIVTKIAQQIDLVELKDLRFLRILISAFVFELLNVKVEKFQKTTKKGNNSYIVSPIVTKIAQQIDLVVLNDLRFSEFW